jgi:hypothetical protein
MSINVGREYEFMYTNIINDNSVSQRGVLQGVIKLFPKRNKWLQA